jgi:hypothetical protein
VACVPSWSEPMKLTRATARFYTNLPDTLYTAANQASRPSNTHDRLAAPRGHRAGWANKEASSRELACGAPFYEAEIDLVTVLVRFGVTTIT